MATRHTTYPVIVSSESVEILAEAERLNVGVLERPSRWSQDWTPDLPVAQHLIFETVLDSDDLIVWLRPTAPFRNPENIKDVVEFMDAHPEIDSIRSVVPAIHHPLKMYKVLGDLSGQPWLAPYISEDSRANHPRQLLPPAFQSAGWIDAVRVRCIRAGSMEGYTIAGLVVPYPAEDRACQIDTLDDLERAATIAAQRRWTPGDCK